MEVVGNDDRRSSASIGETRVDANGSRITPAETESALADLNDKSPARAHDANLCARGESELPQSGCQGA